MTPDETYIAQCEQYSELFATRVGGETPNRKGKREGRLQKPKDRLFQNGANDMLTNETTQESRPRHRTPLPANTINSAPVAASAAHLPIVKTPAAPAPVSLLDVIMQAGSNPDFDVEKFRALVSIQREEQDRQDARADREAALQAEAAFDTALSEVQGKISAVLTNQYNSQTKSRYADYAALNRVIRPIYAPAGFSLAFDEEESPKPDHIRVVCWLKHVAPGAKRGHKQKFHADISCDGKGARGGDVMTKTHAIKSAFTYGKGIVAGNIFNLAIDKDDDGNAAGQKAEPAPKLPGTISAAQVDDIRTWLNSVGKSERALLQAIRLKRLEDIGVEHFDRVIAMIKNGKA